MFTITHINRINTDLTCNCLLAPSSSWCPHKKTKLLSLHATDAHCSSLESADDEANIVSYYYDDDNLYFYAACYELGKTNSSDIQKNCKDTQIEKEEDEEQEENCKESDVRTSNNREKQTSTSPMYRGSVIKYTYSLYSSENNNSYNSILKRFTINEMKDMTYTETYLPNHSVFPGVFDLNYIPRSWTPFAHITHSHYSPGFRATKTYKEEPVLVASCTDGSVWMLNTLPQSHERTEYTTYNSNILSNSHIYSIVGQTMTTSTTPFLFEGSNVPSDDDHVYRPTLHLLTTHHGGGVQVTNTHKQLFNSDNDAKCSLVSKEHKKEKTSPSCTYKQNTHEEESSSSVEQFHLHPHEYDAWCSCVLPLQSTSLSTYLQCMCTGGDDGLLYFHDLRLCDAKDDCIIHNEIEDHECINNTNDNENNIEEYASSIVAKVQFDAGVVSLAPVIEECSSPTISSSPLPQTNSTNTTMISTNWNTPYLLAGCYDESISLLDVRQLTESKYETTVRGNCKKVNTIVRKTNLGGGVWRCNRTLYPTYNNYNKTFTESQEIEIEGSYCRYNNMYMNAVNTNNILVLPLMQRGAALLPYNVKLSANDIFASEPIYFPFEQIQHNLLSESTHTTSLSNTELLPSTSNGTDQECLVYDVAVLHANHDRTQFIVASCSFYERAIDIWEVQC